MKSSELVHFQQTARDIVCTTAEQVLDANSIDYVIESLSTILDHLPLILISDLRFRELGYRYVQYLQDNAFARDNNSLQINPDLLKVARPYHLNENDTRLMSRLGAGLLSSNYGVIRDWITSHEQPSSTEQEGIGNQERI